MPMWLGLGIFINLNTQFVVCFVSIIVGKSSVVLVLAVMVVKLALEFP